MKDQTIAQFLNIKEFPFKMCGIPKEMFGSEATKIKIKRKWWQFWKWHCA